MKMLFTSTPSQHTAARLRGLAVAWLALTAACGALAAPSATGLGTLLYSPAERDEIVRARQGLADSLQEVTQKRLSGIVRRQGGKSTVWVNDEAMQEGDTDTPAIVGVDAVVKDKRLRVGQSVDALTGETHDLVPPGSVRASAASRNR